METRSNHRQRQQKPRRFHWGKTHRFNPCRRPVYSQELMRCAYTVRQNMRSTIHTMPPNTSARILPNKKPFAVLLLGVDTGADGRIEKGNSDTMIVAVVNPKTKKTTMVSIPRDTAAELIGTQRNSTCRRSMPLITSAVRTWPSILSPSWSMSRFLTT